MTPADIATRQQVYLERLKAGYVRGWNGQQAELRKRIDEVLGALRISTMQELTRVELEKVLIRLKDAHVAVSAPAMTAFLVNMPGLAEYAAGLELSSLKALFPNPPRFNAPTAALAYQRALNEPIQAVGQMLTPFINDFGIKDANRINALVRTGWAQNRPLMDMVREVLGTKRNNYKDGALEMTRRHGATLINTATQHIANAARMEVWERNGDIVHQYEWVSTLDRRTTQQCRSLDGQRFEPGKGPMPPIHPNCRSTTTAVLGPEFDFLDEGATRASAVGPVRADLTYYDWLKTQPEDFQTIALGPTRAKLFRDGGLTAERFAELNLGTNFEPLTLVEMRRIEPDAFKQASL